MVQTSFTVGGMGDPTLDQVFTDISTGGIDAATDTDYAITLTATTSFVQNETLTLESGSSLTLEGDALFATGYAFVVVGAVTTDLNFTGTITLDGGSVDNVAVTTSGPTPITGIFSGQIVGTAGDTGDSVVNAGSITYGGSDAAIDFGTSSGATSVQNTGTIDATDVAAAGVVLAAGTVENGPSNATTAQIIGGAYGAAILGAGLVQNEGTISGSTGVYVGSGTVDNGTSTAFAGLISGVVNGVWVGAGTGIVSNFGTIQASGGVGVYLEAGGTLVTGSATDTTALVSGAFEGVLVGQPGSSYAGVVTNYATITANGSDLINRVIGVWLENGGSVQNYGSLSSIQAVDFGVLVEGAAGFVHNEGTISATASIAVSGTTYGFGVDLAAGGTVDNGLAAGSMATIQGVYDGVRIEAGAPGAGAMVENEGTIIGAVGVDFLTGSTAAAGTIVNDGLIKSTGGASGNAVLFGSGTALLVLDPGWSFVGTVVGSTVVGSTTTLVLASGTAGTLSGLANDAGTVTETATSATVDFSDFQTITIDAGASWTISNPGSFPTVVDAGNLTVASGAAVGDLQIGAGGTATLQGSANNAQTIQFVIDAAGDLGLDAPSTGTPSAVQATIEDFGLNGTIDLPNVAYASFDGFDYDAGTSTLYVLDNGGTGAVLAMPGPYTTASFAQHQDGGTGLYITTNVTPCFAAGTGIRTSEGTVPVEALHIGTRVVCADGGLRPVVWLGRRRVDVRRHPAPETVAPVLVRRDSFAERVPRRDLLLSPDHAVYVDGVLIPVKHLIDGHGIAQVAVDEVEYWHVELDRHDVLFAEDLPVESFLDTGNRGAFANGDGPVMLHPAFARDGDAMLLMWEALGYARLVIGGEEVRRVRQRLAQRQADGDADDDAGEAEIVLAAGDCLLRPHVGGDGRMHFHLPRGAAQVVIHSRDAVVAGLPAGRGAIRRRGVAIGAARFLRGDGTAHDVPLDRLGDADGWYPLRTAGPSLFRRTDGAARLAVPDGAFWLELRVLNGKQAAAPRRAIA